MRILKQEYKVYQILIHWGLNYENIKIVFREDFDDNGFLKKDIRNKVHTFLCEETDISEISITIFLDRLNAGKDLWFVIAAVIILFVLFLIFMIF